MCNVGYYLFVVFFIDATCFGLTGHLQVVVMTKGSAAQSEHNNLANSPQCNPGLRLLLQVANSPQGNSCQAFLLQVANSPQVNPT
jgi:hypothetical protein